MTCLRSRRWRNQSFRILCVVWKLVPEIFWHPKSWPFCFTIRVLYRWQHRHDSSETWGMEYVHGRRVLSLRAELSLDYSRSKYWYAPDCDVWLNGTCKQAASHPAQGARPWNWSTTSESQSRVYTLALWCSRAVLRMDSSRMRDWSNEEFPQKCRATKGRAWRRLGQPHRQSWAIHSPRRVSYCRWRLCLHIQG